MADAAPPLPRRAGIGLKADHYAGLLAACRPDQPSWLEVHPQNYFGAGGPPHHWLGALAERYPVSFHSTGLSLGSADGVDSRQLDMLATLADRYRPAAISDHLSWSAFGSGAVPDLLPLPYTAESLGNVSAAVEKVQARLGRRILVENPSRYLSFADDRYEEMEFLHMLCGRTGCGILLDVNNLFVSAFNLGGDAVAMIDAVDAELVCEIHLAGHARERHGEIELLLDDHGSAVCADVWALFRRFVARAGPRATLIEWDASIPDLDMLVAEADKADRILLSEGRHDRAAA